MGNKINCCGKRKLEEEISYKKLTKPQIKDILIKKTKNKSKDEILLKINKIRNLRNGNIVFAVLMGTSSIVTIVAISITGAVEPNIVSGLLISAGATAYYIYEISEKNKIIDIYLEILKNKM